MSSQLLHDAMAAHVAHGELPGLVTLVSRGDDVRVDAIGTLRTGGGGAMQRDTIFRISSMTKPMVAAMAMMLVEEGELALDASVERWLPELAERRVLLGMKDTGFAVPPTQMNRLATSYFANPPTGALELYDEAQGGEWSRAPAFPSAGAGLVSTVDDCFAFAAMMKGGGVLGGVRLLSAASVAAMTTDQIPAAQKAASSTSLDPTFWDTFGWGLGTAVVTRPGADGPSGFGWDGGLGTSMWWDLREDRIAILMTQRSAYPKTSQVYLDFWRSVNGEVRA